VPSTSSSNALSELSQGFDFGGIPADAVVGVQSFIDMHTMWMLGILLTGATSIFCDNESLVKNSTAPESTLKKHHNAIAYHGAAREAQAMGIICVAWESGNTQIGDLLTKLMPGPRLKELIGYVL
jgi:hypothetical protein